MSKYKYNYKLVFSFTFIFFFEVIFFQKSYADQYSKPLAINSHIRILPYSQNEIHHYVGFYGYAASIVFEEGETIGTIAMGDPQAWQLTPADNRLFIKPVKKNAATNALIKTNRREYHFILNTREATGPYDKDLVFETRFSYPGAVITNFSGSGSGSYIPDLVEDHEKLNFEYLVSGSNRIKPIRVFDDGKFTYIQFHPKSTTMPAVFLVEEDGYESLVNVRTVGKYLVVEKLGSVFTLRYDKIYVCIFNQRNPLDLRDVRKYEAKKSYDRKRKGKSCNS